MQLLQLRIKNLNSLKGEHLIDFEKGPIGNTGLFAITGPTGAGKSTILDAITLALYNQTPRSGSVSKNDIARLGSIITRNTDEAWAQLDYRVKNITYRSQWGISRNRNGNLRDYTLVLSKQEDDGQFVSMADKRNEVPKENAKLIGLNFDQFLRSILLSQGDFARFLKSNANERGELLEKITGTEIYRQLGRACYERRGREVKELEYLKIQLEGIEILSEEQRQEEENKLDALKKCNKKREDDLGKFRKQLQKIQEYNQLTASIEEKKKHLAQLNNELEAFKTEQISLEKHQEIVPLKAEILAVEQREKNIKEKQKEKTDKSIKLHSEKNIQDATKAQLKSLKLESDVFDKKQQETQLLIKQVRVLDSEIQVVQNSYQSLEKQNKTIGQQIDELHLEIKKQETLLSSKEKEITSITTFLEKNSRIANAGDQLPLLEQQLQTITHSAELVNNSINSVESAQTRTALQETSEEAVRLTLVQKVVEQSERFIEDQKNILPKELPGIEILKEDAKKLQQKSQAFERLLDVCKEKQRVWAEKESLTKELDISSHNILIKEKELNNIGQALEINQKCLDELNARHERELLEAKYEDARRLLKPDEACPLCGSHQHPYIDNYQSTKSETDEALKKTNAQHRELQNKEKLFGEQLSVLKTTVVNYTKQLAVCDNKLGDYTNLIQQVVDNYSLSLNEVTEKTVKDSRELHLNNFKKLEQQITTIERLEKAIARNKEYTMLANDLKALVKLQNQVTDKLAGFGFNAGMPLSENIESLRKSYSLYAKKKEQLQLEEKELSAQSTAWKEKGKQLQEHIQNFARQSNELNEVKQVLVKQKDKRHKLFGDRVPEEVEQALSKQQSQLDEARKLLEVKLEKSTVLFKTLEERLFDLEKELNEEQQNLLQQSHQLNEKLKQRGLASIKDVLTLLLTDDEARRIQQQQEAFVKTSTELNHSLKEQNEKLSQIKAAVENNRLTEPELKELIAQQELQLKADLGNAGSLQQKIATDIKNKEKQKEKVQAIEKQQKNFQRWDELSSLIGDATGNKFSRFAQELTLKQVLQLANNHLKLLSDRYKVKHVKNDTTDELFVVDMYHGNTERSVKTLSGGESFLVSLSLALGLSDLAGQNTVIGSLFIDEGFGTLDQNTLDVALSALEKLQNETNRTIGIISHVPALKERVTTQIELKKDASGYSSIEVKN